MTVEQRYSTDEQAAQVALIETLRRDEGLSYRKIAQRTGLPLSTVHRRAGQVARLDEMRDVAGANGLRAEATMEVRSWLARLDAATDADPADPLAERVSLLQAFPLVLKAWEFLAVLNGARLPLRVQVDDRRPPDPVLIEALRLEAERTERLDADEVERALADEQAG